MKMASPSSAETAWARAKMDSLFFHWLSSEQGSNFIKSMCEDVKAGRPIAMTNTSSTGTGNAPSPIEVQSSPQKNSRKIPPGEDWNTSSSPNESPSSRTRFTSPRKKSSLSVSSSTSSNSPLASPNGSSAPAPSILSESPASETASKPSLTRIPSFYKDHVRTGKRGPIEEDRLQNRLPELLEVFADNPDGITAKDLLPICKDILEFPSPLNVPLFRRIRLLTRIWNNQPISKNIEAAVVAESEGENSPKTPNNPATMSNAEREQLIELESGTITLEELCEFWRREVEPFDRDERFFRLVKQPHAKFIRAKDFFPIVRELIDGHPGLEFLESTPEFQEKYARTVVARIMHRVNSSWTGEITSRELRRSDLLHYLGVADDEEEINAINEYFSYEHFYVIYCKFWELDADHDFLLSREDIFRHGGHSLTKGIVDRIFQQPCRSFTSGVKGKMGFEDFCFFILCEEDKTNATSIRYWFQLVDLDGDGYLRKWEIRTFYDEQLKRMRSLGHEEVMLEDVFSQMKDCLGHLTGKSILFAEEDEDENGEHKTEDDGEGWKIGVKEFLKPDRLVISGQFFNLLFNLNKFIANEARDPFTTRLMQGEQPLTDWDRYALAEYSRLASAEEARGSNQSHATHAGSGGGFSSDSLGARLMDSDSESEEENDDEGEDEEGDIVDDDEEGSEDSGDFHTKGLSSSSPIFGANGVYRRDEVGATGRQSSDEFSDAELDRSTEEDGSDDGMEPLERTRLSIHYSPSEADWRLPEARFNVASFWLHKSQGQAE